MNELHFMGKTRVYYIDSYSGDDFTLISINNEEDAFYLMVLEDGNVLLLKDVGQEEEELFQAWVKVKPGDKSNEA